jgi:putative sterol carrier protein
MPGNQEPTTIARLKEKLADPSVQDSIKGFSKKIQFSFTDLKEDYVFNIRDGKLASLEKKNVSDSDIVITMQNSLMEDILDKKANPITAYMTGKMKIKGQLDDLVRLQKLMS